MQDESSHVYVIEGGGPEGEPSVCSTLAEVERRIEGLEAQRSDGEATS
jgi:hypothetical protein